MNPELQRKVDFAIHLLQSIPQDGPIELCYSGGKDSDVILELAKMAGIPFEAIYKNTTIDPPGTIQHCRQKGVKIVQPKVSFLQLVEKKGWPTRRARFCCEVLKEYKIHDRAIVGIRRSESTARAKRYKEPEMCRVYSAKQKVRQYFPILEWTDADVEEFIIERGIKCAPMYYDEEGKFHVERRLGCVGCPLQHNRGRKDFLQYPKMLKAWIRAYNNWFTNHPNTKSAKTFVGVYDAVYMKMFCNSMDEFYNKVYPPLFPDLALDTKKYLEEYFKIDLTL